MGEPITATQSAKSATKSRKGIDMKPVCKRCGKKVSAVRINGKCIKCCDAEERIEKIEMEKSAKLMHRKTFNKMHKPKCEILRQAFSIKEKIGMSATEFYKSTEVNREDMIQFDIGPCPAEKCDRIYNKYHIWICKREICV